VSTTTILVIILIIVLLGGGFYGHSSGWGPYPLGGFALVAVILLVLLLVGVL
jgi:hypothetical protein